MITKKAIVSFLIFATCIVLSLRFGGSVAEVLRPSILYVLLAIFTFTITANSSIVALGNGAAKAFVGFVTYGFIAVIWTEAIGYGFSKIVLLFLMNLFFLFSSRFITENFERVSFYFLVSNILFLGLFYKVFGSPWDLITNISGVRLKDESTSPITYARYLGVASIFVVFLMIQRKSILVRITLAGVLITSFAYMFLSGSKGPVFALFLAFLAIILLHYKGIVKKVFTISGIVALVLYLVANVSQIGKTASTIMTNRFLEAGNSYDSRGRLFEQAWHFFYSGDFFSVMFGAGAGNFGAMVVGRDNRAYPHNLFLEVLYELGLVGFILLMVFVGYSLAGFVKFSRDRVYVFILALFIYTLANSMVSDDLIGNFLFFGSGILLAERKRYLINETTVYVNVISQKRVMYETS